MKSGWVIKKLGEVCEASNGLWKGKKGPFRKIAVLRSTNFTKECQLDLSDVVYIDVESRLLPRKLLREGDIIIEKSGGGPRQPVGRPVYFDKNVGEYSFCNFTSMLRVADSDVLPLYLHRCLYYLYVSGATESLQSYTIGLRNLDFKGYLDLDIPIPPLSEQKRIVAKIDAAFEKIDKLKANAERNLANAKELFQSALDEAMRPKKGWVEKRLGEVCDGRLSYGTSAPSCPYNGKVRYIRITDIDDEGRLLDELVSPKTFERKHILVEGDIVLARTGATVGKSYLYSPSDGDCVYAGYLIRARVNRSMVLPEFAFYFTKTGSYWQYIHTEQASAAQPNVNAEKYGNLLMPVPPLKEQREIVAMARVIHGKSLKLQHHYARQIADCAEMRQSVLREAFEGRL